MDSGTSGGSMQSGSTGGEDDQNDSGSFSAFSRLHHSNPDLTHQHVFSHEQQRHLQFPPLTNNLLFFDTLPQSDLDRVWSAGLTRQPPPPQPQLQEPHHHHHHQQQQQQQMLYSGSSSSLLASSSSAAPKDPQPKPPGSGRPRSGKGTGPGSSGRVEKKRTRASRKTPTTVLTTDTANFRAMVQEFTGIPVPPFGASPFFPARKPHLSGGPSHITAAAVTDDITPSLGSLLHSLSNPNPFAVSNDPSSGFQGEQVGRMGTMMPGSNNDAMYANPTTQLGQNQNNNLGAFRSSSPGLQRPFSSSEYHSRGGENDL